MKSVKLKEPKDEANQETKAAGGCVLTVIGLIIGSVIVYGLYVFFAL